MKKIQIPAILVSLGLFAACSEMSNKEVDTKEEVQEIAAADTAVMHGDVEGLTEADGVEIKTLDENFWNNIDFNIPLVDEPRLEKVDIEKRANEEYTVYSIDEKVLFDLDKAAIRSGAEDKLEQVVASIKEMSPQNRSQIRVFGYTDAQGSKSYNKDLAEDRAEAVKNWLQEEGDIDASRISVQAVGEARPVASNETAAGRQKNRRVEIVVVNR